MKYIKLPISINRQIEKLKERGLLFDDETIAEHYLSNISYYRLRAYTYPFQDNSILRNTCAHHARVWNRRLPAITIPKKTSYSYVNNKNIYNNKLYSYVCSIEYLLNIISPEHGFKNNFRQLIDTCPLFQEREMGFPINWRDEDFWK
jgi:abortive infection bacteriophage resistance protein